MGRLRLSLESFPSGLRSPIACSKYVCLVEALEGVSSKGLLQWIAKPCKHPSYPCRPITYTSSLSPLPLAHSTPATRVLLATPCKCQAHLHPRAIACAAPSGCRALSSEICLAHFHLLQVMSEHRLTVRLSLKPDLNMHPPTNHPPRHKHSLISLPAFFFQNISSHLTHDVFYLFICLFSISVSLPSTSSMRKAGVFVCFLPVPEPYPHHTRPPISALCGTRTLPGTK